MAQAPSHSAAVPLASLKQFNDINNDELRLLRRKFNDARDILSADLSFLPISSDRRAAIHGSALAAVNLVSPVLAKATKVHSAQSLKQIKRISTGIATLNELLHGGYAIGELTEIHGTENSGKTAIGSLLACTAQIDGENAGMVGIVPCKGPDNFKTQKLVSVSSGFGFNQKEVLQNVRIMKYAKTRAGVRFAYAQLDTLAKKSDLAAVFMDDTINGFNEVPSGYERAVAADDIIGKYGLLAADNDVAVVISNSMFKNRSNNYALQPYCTKQVAKVATTRIRITRLSPVDGVLEIIAAPKQSDIGRKASFKFDEDGLIQKQ